jgi:hypothetical protein
MRWNSWNFANRLVLPLLATIQRTCWLWPWLGLLQAFVAPGHPAPLLSAWALTLLPMFSLLLGRWAVGYDPPPAQSQLSARIARTPNIANLSWQLRIGVAVCGFAGTLFVLWWQFYRPQFALWQVAWLDDFSRALFGAASAAIAMPFVNLVVLLYLWLRGLLAVSEYYGHSELWRSMLTGIAAFAFYFVFAQWIIPTDQPVLGSLVLLFFAAGLLALAIAAFPISYTVGWSPYSWGANPALSANNMYNRYWLASLLATVGSLIGLGLLLAAVIAPEQIRWGLGMISALLSPMWRLLAFVILGLAYVSALLADLLVRFLRQLLANRQPFQPEDAAAGALPTPVPFSEIDEARLQAFNNMVHTWTVILVLLLLFVLFLLALQRLRQSRVRELDEERQSIFSSTLLQEQLTSLWQSLLGRLRRVRTTLPFLDLAHEEERRRAIRHLYQQLLAKTANAGYARQPSQTPHEYQEQLQSVLVETKDFLTALTGNYNDVRYASSLPTLEIVVQSEDAWHRIEQQIDEIASGNVHEEE